MQVGVVFTKLSRPKKRAATLLFSQHAAICLRNGQLVLVFRVGDMRIRSHIVQSTVRAQFIRHRVTQEGEDVTYVPTELNLGADPREDRLFFIWPVDVVHTIDRSSPFYELSASDLLRDRFELVVILDGIIESTGQTTQARSSYLPNEILWGHRFQPMVSYDVESGSYTVDYRGFDKTYEVDTPLCSMKELDEYYKTHGMTSPVS